MRRATATVIAAAMIGVASAACTALDPVLEDGADAVAELSERARFCIALARTVAAVESGSPATAVEAAEELLAQAPPELRADAQALIGALADARRGGDAALADPELVAAAERLADDAAAMCDPRDQDDAP